MWTPNRYASSAKKGVGNGLVAVAIDKDKGSQHALRWAVENLLSRGQTVILIHVVNKAASVTHVASTAVVCDINLPLSNKQMAEKLSKDLFLTFHCYCTRKDIHCLDIILEDTDIVKALTEYVSYAAIEKLVLGAPARSGFMRKFRADIPSCVSKLSPDFCTVYVISKGKVSSVRNASRSAPHSSPLLDEIKKQNTDSVDKPFLHSGSVKGADRMVKPRTSVDRASRSPYPGARPSLMKAFGDFSESDTDISFVSSERPSTDRNSSVFFDSFVDSSRNSRISSSTDHSIGSMRLGIKWSDRTTPHEFSSVSQESGRSSCSSQNLEEVEAEMRRLRLELKQTMDLYSNACREALSAKQQAMELNRCKHQEEQRLEEARLAEEAAMSAAEKERVKCQEAVQAAEAAQKVAESESLRRLKIDGETLRETVEMKKMLDTLSRSNIKYRRYSIEEIEQATDGFACSRKIGEGGYGPVYKCYLDHTSVAVKVLRPDAAQGRLQFLQEIEVLSCIRHPNMVLLLGACPEYGILVYEYMGKGSLDDCIFRRANTPAMSWQLRFRIAAEIATGLLFLHQTKPEPIVHRDLKPGNILLDHNYVSKISDVGLARLVPAVAENVTQFRVTSTAGTFCYIDPEYQQTGMLGVKSDVYSLGILLLQLITAKPPMGLTHYVERAIEKGTFFTEMLDPAVTDWPAEETLSLAKLALQCAELRRKDRPDLGKEVLPELCRLRDIAEEKMNHFFFAHSAGPSPNHSQVSSISQEAKSDAYQVENSTSSKTEEEKSDKD
ncbi:Kinase protein with adenine nucleotide alpha hydrolases-like domain, putative isoform 1 [Theobroma cacao]|uniref:RING-type E3 ubiquitin transferase n=1 Tax=Theobroma cacao TaxID=3641 RepID=A0A061GAU0_THECC|nr:Kinase protein with adenine nucleotide alpha hydrolases-like domain, putative isoform 1 [Theobroma cacao]